MRKCEDDWRASQSEVRKNIKELKDEFRKLDPNFVRDSRMNYLETRMKELLDEIWSIGCWCEEARTHGKIEGEIIAYMHKKELRQKNSEYKRFYVEFGMLKSGIPVKENEITPEIIDSARKVPIENFISFSKSGLATCLWHSDSRPSLKFWKNTNLAHCFSCGKTADTIEAVRKVYDYNFVEAINFLKQYF